MGSNRQYIRIKCDSQCILMDIDGSTYEAMLGDISLGGALVKISSVPGKFQVGDVCDLMLCTDPDSCPVKHTCRVIRTDSANMGVRFLTNRAQ
jgi:hypothetical protein